MPRVLTIAASRVVVAARRVVVGAALIGGLTAITLNNAAPLQASGGGTFSSDLATAGMQAAVRGKATPLVSAPPAPVPTPTPTPSRLGSLSAFELEVVALTNAERVNAGLAPFTYSTLLSNASRRHAVDQRNRPCEYGYLTHTGTDGTSGADRILATGMSISRWGENVACAHPSPASVVRGWMKSPGHRANILNPLFTHIGAGTASSDTGQYYWVQNFATAR